MSVPNEQNYKGKITKMIIRGMIISFICLFIYLLAGIAILEIMLWHVRKGDYIIGDWLKEPVEESEQTSIIFLIAAAIIHKEKEEEKPEAQQANDEGEIINKLDRAKKVIRDYYMSARCGIYDCRNNAGDDMYIIYQDDEIEIDICYHYEYFEVFGLKDDEFEDLEKYYDKLVEG